MKPAYRAISVAVCLVGGTAFLSQPVPILQLAGFLCCVVGGHHLGALTSEADKR